jgi:hypothetical protein
MKKREQVPSLVNQVQVEVHKRRDEFLWNLRRLARRGDEVEFKSYLTEVCGVVPGDPAYEPAVRAFWNAVREFERGP